MLVHLPCLQHAEPIVASCRLYALALELIHSRPDIAYQLLISSVETLADAILKDFAPVDEAKVEHQKQTYDLAKSFGLSEENARQLAIVACSREYWIKRKFKKVLLDNVDGRLWTEQDDLFPQISPEILPKRENFEKTLGKVYDARCRATHVGEAFPRSASYTGGPKIDSRAAMVLYSSDNAFPPVIWFEGVVNSAIF